MRKTLIAWGTALLGALFAWADTTAPNWKPVTQPDTIIGYYTVKDAQTQVALEADGSKLGAFSSSGECRGVAEIIQGPVGKLFQITIGVASSSEMNLSFKVWDAGSGVTYDVKEKIESVAGVETIGTIAAPSTLTCGGVIPPQPTKYMVTFDLGAHGTRTGGGELEQQIESGKAATAPEFTVEDGWRFTGWDKSFASVTADMTVTALYKSIGDDDDPANWVPVTQPDTIIGYYTVKDAQTQVALEADGSKLGVFSSSGECRGVAEIMQGPVGKLFQITIGVASSSEMNLSFKVWDAGSGATYEVNEKIESVAGVETIGTIAAPSTLTYGLPPPPTTYAVTFDLGAHGTRTGGGELEQQVESGKAATAPEFTVDDGWQFTGWDKSFASVTADMTVTAQYAPLPVPSVYTITYVGLEDAANTNVTEFTTNDLPLVLGPVERERYEFLGWTPNDGVIPLGTASNVTFTANWEEIVDPQPVESGRLVSEVETHVDVEKGEKAPYETAAAVYDGYLYDGDVIVGSVQVKVSKGKVNKKSGKFEAKVTATVQLADETKKLSFKGGIADHAGNVLEMTDKNGRKLAVTVGMKGIGGTFDGKYKIDGARNVFSGKSDSDKMAAKDATDRYLGTYNVAYDRGTLSVVVGKKGKTKVSGSVEGNKVSVTCQLVVGNGAAAVPVVIAKKTNLSFCLWLAENGEIEVRGASTGMSLLRMEAGKAGLLGVGEKFAVDTAELEKLFPGLYSSYLPNDVSISLGGKKWVVANGAKAGKLVYDQVSGTLDPVKSKITANTSGLKLTYKAKNGTFTGSFKVFNLENGKVKAYTASVTGVMIGEKGYGTATIKKVGTVAVGISNSMEDQALYCVIDLSRRDEGGLCPVTYLMREPPEGWTDEYKSTKLAMRYITPGSFRMGGKTNDVLLTKPFYFGVFEVTQRQWELVMGDNPSNFKGDLLPVESVSYNMIRGGDRGAHWPVSADVDETSFLGRLQACTGLRIDLPTEAQWEYACRAGRKANTAYNYGDNPNGEYMWYDKNSDSQTHDVGMLRPNAWGLYDMHGNVGEWCLDLWGPLSSMTDPRGAETGTERVCRGGGWNESSYDCRLVQRSHYSPSVANSNLGFRISVTLQ